MPRPPTPPAKLARIRAMAYRAVPRNEIAQAVGLTPGRVYQILAGQGKRARRTSATEARDQAIRAAAWRANSAGERAPVAELAERYHLTRARIYQILHGAR